MRKYLHLTSIEAYNDVVEAHNALLDRLQAVEAERDALRGALQTYGDHQSTCNVWHCAHCGFREWVHDAAEDIDEQTCARHGQRFTAKTDCTCGFAALRTDRADPPGSRARETPQ